MFVLSVTNVQLQFWAHVLLVVLFFLVSMYIAYHSTLAYLADEMSVVGQMLLGFYGLPLISYMFYILNFIPVPFGKHQSFRDRREEIKSHAWDLRNKYVDTDMSLLRVASIVMLVSFLFVYHEIFNEWFTALMCVLILGDVITTRKLFNTYPEISNAKKK